jgi:hypothetical protein
MVIVCLFVSKRLDDSEIKEGGSQSQPSNDGGDYSTEDEECFDIAKPSFDHIITQLYLHIYLLKLLLKKCK